MPEITIYKIGSAAAQRGGGTQEGGKLLGSGGYGCIFQPPLICKGGPRGPPQAGRLGKFTEKEDAEMEISVAKYFKSVPNVANYLLLPHIETYCEPAPYEQQKEPGIDICEKKNRDDGRQVDFKANWMKYRQFEMDYGGRPISSVFPRDKAMSQIPAGFDFSVFVRQLLEIGAFLALNGLVHNDLHSGNILLNDAFKPRLIDYGRAYIIGAFDEKRYNDLKAAFTASRGQIAPEMSMMDGVDEGYSLSHMFDAFVNKNPPMREVEKVLGVPRQKQLAELNTFWKSSVAVQKKDWFRFYKLYWPLVDAWSMGSIILRILTKMMLFRGFTDSAAWKEKSGVIKMIIRGLLRTSPRNRIDCVEALFLYDPTNEMVTSEIGLKWLQKRQDYREKRVAQKGGRQSLEANDDGVDLYAEDDDD